MQNKLAQLTEGSVKKILLKLTLPRAIGNIAYLLFSIVDTFYVGLLGSKELAAISFTFPIAFIVTSLAIGLGIGSCTVIADTIGQGLHHKVNRLTSDSMMLALLMVLLLASLGLLTIDSVFTMLGASSQMLPLIREYMEVWYLGVGFLVIPMIGNNAMLATGDSKTPTKIVLIATIVNAILDPFLIFGMGPFPQLELMGAALATGISFAIAMIASLWILVKHKKMLDYSIPSLYIMFDSWKQILKIGLPAAASNMLLPISTAILTRMVSIHGSAAVAAFGVGSRIESLALIGIQSFASVTAPFVGQNWGAKQYERIKHGVRFGFQFSLIWGGIIGLLLAVLAYPIASIFSDEVQIQNLIVLYLWMIPLSFGCFGIMLIVNSTFNALNKAAIATLLIAIRLFILMIPLTYLGSVFLGIQGIYVGMSIGNIFIGLIAYIFINKHFNSSKSIVLVSP